MAVRPESDPSTPAAAPAARMSARMRRGELFSPDCPSREVLQHVTSRWGVLLLVALMGGTHRFSALRRKVGGVSEKMLAQTLRGLDHRAVLGGTAADLARQDQQQLVGASEGRGQRRRTGAVRFADDDAERGEVGRLGGAAHRGDDRVGGLGAQQRLDDEAAESAAATGVHADTARPPGRRPCAGAGRLDRGPPAAGDAGTSGPQRRGAWQWQAFPCGVMQ